MQGETSWFTFLPDQIHGQMIWPDLDLPNGTGISPGSCDAPAFKKGV